MDTKEDSALNKKMLSVSLKIGVIFTFVINALISNIALQVLLSYCQT